MDNLSLKLVFGMFTLTKDVLFVLFRYLPEDQWSNLEEVCTSWREAVMWLYKQKNELNLETILTRKQLTQISTINKERLLNVLRKSPNVESFQTDLKVKSNWSVLSDLPDAFPKLKDLRCENIMLLPFQALHFRTKKRRVYRYLTSVAFENCFNEDIAQSYPQRGPPLEKYLSDFLERCPVLEHLSLAYGTLLTGISLSSINVTLRSLDLSFCRRLDEQWLINLLKRAKTLNSLILYSTEQLTGSFLRYLCDVMDKLDIGYCSKVVEIQLIDYVRTKSIKELRISHIDCLSSRVFDVMGPNFCTTLCHLTLTDYYKDHFHDKLTHQSDFTKGLMQVGKCRNLVHLNLESNDFVNDDVIDDFSSRCHKLKHLNLASVDNVSEAGFRYLKRCRKLTWLNLSGNDIRVTTLLDIIGVNKIETLIAKESVLKEMVMISSNFEVTHTYLNT